MIETVIKSIMDAESEAEAILKAASQKVKEVIIKAKEDSQEIARAAEAEIDAKVGAIKDEAEKQAQVLYTEIVTKGKEDADNFIKKVNSKAQEAIDFVAKELIDLYGNC